MPFSKIHCLTGLYGLGAGVLAALTLSLMGGLEHLLWQGEPGAWRIFCTIMAGGGVIAFLNWRMSLMKTDAFDAVESGKRRMALIAISAIVAVGFGGAIGPEAGLIAVVSEAASLMAVLLSQEKPEAQYLQKASSVAALSGLYAAPLPEPLDEQGPDDAPELSNAQNILASMAGIVGFLLVHHWLSAPGQGKLPLPEVQAVQNSGLSEIIEAIVPALLGAAMGVLYLQLLPWLERRLSRLGGRTAQILVGSALFAALAACFPLVRFSGHHELYEALGHAIDQSGGALLGLAGLKVAALCLCLASGWRGGAIFPLIFAGAAAGAAASMLAPAMDVQAAVVAGLSAASMIGLGRPLIVFVLLSFLTGLQMPFAMCVGLITGHIILKQFNLRPPH